MTTQAPPSNLLPLNPEQLARLQAATTDFTPTQLAWVSGYFWGVLNQQSGAAVAAPAPAAEVPTITLISASQTGNARRVAEALRDDLLAAKLNVKLVNAGDYKFKQIAAEKLLVVVTSTRKESRRKKRSHCISSCSLRKRRSWTGLRSPSLVSAIPLMNFSVSPAKISTTSWPSSARNVCSIALMPTLNIRPRPLNGARARG